MSPANTAPRFTPILIGIPRSTSAILRSASSIRSSSLPVIVGAPAVRISLPPSSSASVERKQTPYSSHAACVSASSTWRSSATAAGPRSSIIPSVPSKWMNAIEICRCSGVPPPAKHVRSHRGRQAVRDRVRIDVVRGDLGRDVVARRLSLQKETRPLRFPEAASRDGGGDLRAHEDLARLRDVLHPDRPRPPGPGHDQLAVGPADVEEVIRARVHADRHPQLDVRAGHFDPADLTQRPPHPHRRAAGVRHVIVFLEQQQQRVAAELDEAAVVGVGDRQQVGEAGLDRVRDLLGALLPHLRELLGQLREAGDVDEDDGALRRPPRRFGILGEVAQQDPGHVGRGGGLAARLRLDLRYHARLTSRRPRSSRTCRCTSSSSGCTTNGTCSGIDRSRRS